MIGGGDSRVSASATGAGGAYAARVTRVDTSVTGVERTFVEIRRLRRGYEYGPCVLLDSFTGTLAVGDEVIVSLIQGRAETPAIVGRITPEAIPDPAVGQADKHYVHTQAGAAASWVITHNLGKYPSVTIIDSSGRNIEADVEYNTLNTLTITFSVAISGAAYLN